MHQARGSPVSFETKGGKHGLCCFFDQESTDPVLLQIHQCDHEDGRGFSRDAARVRPRPQRPTTPVFRQTMPLPRLSERSRVRPFESKPSSRMYREPRKCICTMGHANSALGAALHEHSRILATSNRLRVRGACPFIAGSLAPLLLDAIWREPTEARDSSSLS